MADPILSLPGPAEVKEQMGVKTPIVAGPVSADASYKDLEKGIGQTTAQSQAASQETMYALGRGMDVMTRGLEKYATLKKDFSQQQQHQLIEMQAAITRKDKLSVIPGVALDILSIFDNDFSPSHQDTRVRLADLEIRKIENKKLDLDATRDLMLTTVDNSIKASLGMTQETVRQTQILGQGNAQKREAEKSAFQSELEGVARLGDKELSVMAKSGGNSNLSMGLLQQEVTRRSMQNTSFENAQQAVQSGRIDLINKNVAQFLSWTTAGEATKMLASMGDANEITLPGGVKISKQHLAMHVLVQAKIDDEEVTRRLKLKEDVNASKKSDAVRASDLADAGAVYSSSHRRLGNIVQANNGVATPEIRSMMETYNNVMLTELQEKNPELYVENAKRMAKTLDDQKKRAVESVPEGMRHAMRQMVDTGEVSDAASAALAMAEFGRNPQVGMGSPSYAIMRKFSDNLVNIMKDKETLNLTGAPTNADMFAAFNSGNKPNPKHIQSVELALRETKGFEQEVFNPVSQKIEKVPMTPVQAYAQQQLARYGQEILVELARPANGGAVHPYVNYYNKFLSHDGKSLSTSYLVNGNFSVGKIIQELERETLDLQSKRLLNTGDSLAEIFLQRLESPERRRQFTNDSQGRMNFPEKVLSRLVASNREGDVIIPGLSQMRGLIEPIREAWRAGQMTGLLATVQQGTRAAALKAMDPAYMTPGEKVGKETTDALARVRGQSVADDIGIVMGTIDNTQRQNRTTGR